MLDRFDLALLNNVQRDDSQTADQLARTVALSPSAVARRLRKLRGGGWIGRTIALLSPRLTEDRLRALVFIQLNEHADIEGKTALERCLLECDEIQLCYEIAGAYDFVALVDCANMGKFNALCDDVLTTATVRRYETTFVKREVKFAPFIELGVTA